MYKSNMIRSTTQGETLQTDFFNVFQWWNVYRYQISLNVDYCPNLFTTLVALSILLNIISIIGDRMLDRDGSCGISNATNRTKARVYFIPMALT